jgi:cellulose synthase/poly-beta-1,6-N-acetylglucosamine synthase-like glycosyltransferase
VTIAMSVQVQAKLIESGPTVQSERDGSRCVMLPEHALSEPQLIPTATINDTGFVVVGRNEGERLRRCLIAITRLGLPVVYVDGNSTDGSIELARSLGADVIEEDPSQRNCTARARNAGFRRLCEVNPKINFVQFLDADCEMVDGWLGRGRRVLEDRPDVALVTGRRRERFPEQSVYNRLADIDWDFPVGEISGSHGDMMVRSEAFHQVGGFNPVILVGEDLELCLRLRSAGWKLIRIDAEISVHDIAMTSFWEWWRRCIRTGRGFAHGALLHGAGPERYCVRSVRSSAFWGIAIPLLILGFAWPTRGASLILILAYPFQAVRIALRHRAAGMTSRNAWLFGWFCSVAQIPHAVGMLDFWVERFLNLSKKDRVITYK